MEEIISKWGLPVAGLFALGWYILSIEKRHKEERNEWRQTMKQQFDKVDEREKETNEVTRGVTNVLHGLKTLLENKK